MALAILVLPSLVLALSTGGSPPTNRLNPLGGGYDWNAPLRHRPNPRTLSVGVTHTQYSIDTWGDDAAEASARGVLTATATYQNQHIYGWGALNPEPAPGVYDWSSLDRRIALIRSTGGTPVITLCCAPDWMTGGQPGETNWQRLGTAPTPQHYADFAALAVAVARRYPDVRHFQVWNEMKGFWSDRLGRWDYASYTDFYNVVYDALKAVDRGIAVGGPYVTIDVWGGRGAGGHPSALTGQCGTVDQRSLDVLDYWLKHKHGADFVAIDGGTGTRDDGEIASTTVSAAIFDVVTRWVRQRTSLPVWWSEFHVGSTTSDGQQRLVARAVSALLHMADAGVSVALVWQPQRDATVPATRPPALWTSTENADGGRPLAYAQALARMQQVLADPAGTDPVSWPASDVGVLRGNRALLLVHTSGDSVQVDVLGRAVHLGPYEVRYFAMPSGSWAERPEPISWMPRTLSITPMNQCLQLMPMPAQVPPGETAR